MTRRLFNISLPIHFGILFIGILCLTACSTAKGPSKSPGNREKIVSPSDTLQKKKEQVPPSIYAPQSAANKTTLILQHLSSDAQAVELSKYVSDLLAYDNNPLNYLPILSQLDTINEVLARFESIKAIGLNKFVVDLHTLDDAKDALDKPYDGKKINALTNRIDSLTFPTQKQMDNSGVDSIKYSVEKYFSITAYFRDLLTDMIKGQEEYMDATDNKKAEILEKIAKYRNHDRNIEISRIPYMKAQLDSVFQFCPCDESGKPLPEQFDVEKLQELYDANEEARGTRIKDDKKSKK